MPRIYARRQEPRVHAINYNKLQTYARPVPNPNPNPVINQPHLVNPMHDAVTNLIPNAVPQIIPTI